MQLSCPTCASRIHAENINIQDQIAVCANCDTVFEFGTPSEKAKRRKVKQPQGLTIQDDYNLTFKFRTNWRLDQNQSLISGTFGAGIGIFTTNFLVLGLFTGTVSSLLLPIMTGLIAILMIYYVLLVAYNHTEMILDDDEIRVSRQPLPSLNQETVISLQGVESIHCEETKASQQYGYDTPRYEISATTFDGIRRPIVTDLVEDYAYFITQQLNEALQTPDDLEFIDHLALVDEDTTTTRYTHQSAQSVSES